MYINLGRQEKKLQPRQRPDRRILSPKERWRWSVSERTHPTSLESKGSGRNAFILTRFRYLHLYNKGNVRTHGFLTGLPERPDLWAERQKVNSTAYFTKVEIDSWEAFITEERHDSIKQMIMRTLSTSPGPINSNSS